MAKAIFLLTLTLFMSSPSFAQNVKMVGVAKKINDDKVRYIEVHCVAGTKEQTKNVEYLDSNRDRFAKKTFSGESANLWVPQYEFTHTLFGMSESLSLIDNGIVLRRKADGDSNWESKVLTKKDDESMPRIADAGFDQFIRDNFQPLSKGKALRVEYLSAPRLSAIDFDIVPIGSTDNRLTIEIRPQNMLLRWLLDPIEVQYGTSDKKLLSFKGLSNVPRTPSKNFLVDISYYYPPFSNDFEYLYEFCQ